VNILACRIDVFIDGYKRGLHHVQAGEPRPRNICERRCRCIKERLLHFVESGPQIDRDEDNGRACGRLGRALSDLRASFFAVVNAGCRPDQPAQAGSALSQLHEVKVTQIVRRYPTRIV
jgi:hypothetical protein